MHATFLPLAACAREHDLLQRPLPGQQARRFSHACLGLQSAEVRTTYWYTSRWFILVNRSCEASGLSSGRFAEHLMLHG